MSLQFDISFYGLPCEWLSLDAMDISGEMHLDVVSSHSAFAKPKPERHAHASSHQIMILRAYEQRVIIAAFNPKEALK